MDFLSPELEDLLKKCIENEADFPKVLREMFENGNNLENSRLRGKIKSLIDEGYISKLSWGDNLPLFGRIEQKGYDYFKLKDIYIRARLRQDSYFILLDKESEDALKRLVSFSEDFISLSGKTSEGKIYENLAQKGYIKIGAKGLSYMLNGGFVGVVSVTQSGKQYFTEKENRIEEIMFAQSDNIVQLNKSGLYYDVFISHANKDKIEYVDELKESLDKLKIKIFYDKDSLEWGDNWKQRILEGVKESEFAIIVISENFFDREWTEKELNEFLNRQNRNGQKIILPILHNITIGQLQVKYPAVADIQALDSSKYTCDEIALQFAGQLIKRLKA